MKSFAVFALLFAAVVASPLYQQEDVKLEMPVEPVAADWQLVPDGDGNMHLVDIKAEVMPIEPAFNAVNDVRFLLVTNSNRNNPQQITLNNGGQLQGSPFNANWPTRVIVHGWNNDGNSGINTLLRNSYLNRGNFNVFIVDWGAGAQTINYIAARDRVNEVGVVVARFIDFINSNGAAFSSITVVGHSLGAHISGIAGKRVTRGRIQTIVALDPALPLFDVNDAANRVHYGDANYVESHHTDVNRLGFHTPIGHASFYPNWGTSQPGCGLDAAGTCGHSRAWEFFGESIAASNGFWATRCSAGFSSIQSRNCQPSGSSQLKGGEPVTRAPDGVYYLGTNAGSPFAQGWR